MALQKVVSKPESGIEEVSEDYGKLYEKCKVDLTKTLPAPKILISIGSDNYGKPIAVCTEGEFSCIVAPSKTKKSFLKSAICAAYIGGQTNTKILHINGHRKNDDYIYDFDTEQGKYYAQRTFKRTEQLTGSVYPNYVPMQLRGLTPHLRLMLIDWVFTKSPHAGKIKMAFIDGVADLIDDVNNLVMSNMLATYILKWTNELNIHICAIIHKAFGNDKATGHLGSAVTKKAETLIYLDPLTDNHGKVINFNTVRVRCGVSRGKMFDDFLMSVDINGLPYTHDLEDNEITAPKTNKKGGKKDLFTAQGTTKSDEIKNQVEDKDDLPF